MECLEWNGLLERPTLAEFATASGQTVLVLERLFRNSTGSADRAFDGLSGAARDHTEWTDGGRIVELLTVVRLVND
jgi:hypothetical protein